MWTLRINGVDYDKKVNRYEYTTSRTRVEGSNGGTSKAGISIVDLIRTRVVLEMELNPLTAAEYAALLTDFEEPYVFVDYYDDKTMEIRRAEMVPELSGGKKAFVRGRVWFKDLSLTLKER